MNIKKPLSEKQKQYLMVAVVIVVGLVLTVLMTVLNPKAVAPFVGFFTQIGMFLLLLGMGATMLAGGGFLGFAVRWIVTKLDYRYGRNVYMANGAHWLIVLVFGICTALTWTWLVPALVNLPTWMRELYIRFDLLTNLNEYVPLWWGLEGFVTFVVGYWLNEIKRL